MSPNMSDDNSEEGLTFFESNEIIQEPSKSDVLCGRGGSINSHPGNERFRLLVEKRKRVYLTARFKREKRLIASSIVSEIRALTPSGRFLARDSKSGFWKDIGDEKARDKTSQALRENAPSIRAEIETEINEQRAEIKRDEGVPQQPHPPPPYYGGGWGGYSFYGNYPAHTPSAYPPPPPHHQHPPQPQYDYSHHGQAPHEAPHPHYYAQPTGSSTSAIEPIFDFMNAGAETFKNWATSSLNSVIASGASRDGHDSRSINSKPISYIHEDMTRKRRLVKFKDEYSPMTHGSINSIATDNDLEPHHIEHNTETSNSVLAHFADRVMGSLGSFDAVSVMCGQDSTDTKIPFPVSSGGNHHVADEEMEEVEWEGQEVQLMEQIVPDERVMPPPDVRPRPVYDAASSMGMSSVGSCHSWFPEQISAASSYFRGADESVGSNECGMSVGGNSLVRVFDHEAGTDSVIGPTASWERASFPSRSPLNLGSDDESLISKGSNKSGSLASRSMDMMWESRE